MNAPNETAQREPRQESHAGPALILAREPEQLKSTPPVGGERVWLALAFVSGVSTPELRAAVEASPRPLAEMKHLLAGARTRLQMRGAA
jgi:hypothetical protein